jgi:putative transposase
VAEITHVATAEGYHRERPGQRLAYESFVSTPKAEQVSNLRRFPSRQAAKTAVFDYPETFYDTRRLHPALGHRSPADFEEDRMEEARVA